MSGIVDVINNVNANQQMTIIEGDHPELSVEEFDFNAIRLYPNPVSKTLNIDGVTTISQIEVYSLDGKKHIVDAINKINYLDVSSLNSGLYLVKIINKDATIFRKFIKN